MYFFPFNFIEKMYSTLLGRIDNKSFINISVWVLHKNYAIQLKRYKCTFCIWLFNILEVRKTEKIPKAKTK